MELYIIIGIASGILFFVIGFITHKKVSEAKIEDVEELAREIINNAKAEAEEKKEEAALYAKDSWFARKEEFEEETRKKRFEIQKQEKRLLSKETNLDRKVDILNNKEREINVRFRDLQTRERILKVKEDRVSELVEEQNKKLEQISGLTADEAKNMLLSNLEKKAKEEATAMIKDIKDQALNQADKEAKKIVSLAIQRCAIDQVNESTVTLVSIPSDDMKGRIIGREGRNIRAFETATGIDLIIDDNPEIVALSGFDPVRREIAKIALEHLILDGRIHPARIEELVIKSQEEFDNTIREIGEQTMFDVGIHGLDSNLIKMLGKLKFKTCWGQNVLQHCKEVAYISGLMATFLEIDSRLTARAGLLHEVGLAVDNTLDSHASQIGADMLKRYKEPSEVVNTAMSFGPGQTPESVIAILVHAADSISRERLGARKETLANFIKRLSGLEELANSFPGVEKSYAIQAGRELIIIVENKQIDDARATTLAEEIAAKVEEKTQYPGQIKIYVIREFRTIEYAK